MRIEIKGKNLVITEAIERNIIDHLGKLEKYFTEDVQIDVIVKNYEEMQKIEVTIPLDERHTIRQEVVDYDLYKATNIATKKIEKQIRKVREIAKDNNKKEVLNKMIEEVEVAKDIVKEKTFELKPMYEDEALLQFEMIGHEFYAYKDAKIGEIVLLYKRNKNGIGKIVLR